jgi:sugar phosphate permease
VEQNTDSKITASAQGLFMLMTNGIGAVLGNLIAGQVIRQWFEDPATLVKDWPGIWISFAGYALVVAILFAVLFRHKHNPEETVSISH